MKKKFPSMLCNPTQKYEEKREAEGQGEFSVGLAARRDVAKQTAT
jgi:hypothetical protein